MKKYLIKKASTEPINILFEYLKKVVKEDDWFCDANVSICKNNDINIEMPSNNYLNRWHFNN